MPAAALRNGTLHMHAGPTVRNAAEVHMLMQLGVEGGNVCIAVLWFRGSDVHLFLLHCRWNLISRDIFQEHLGPVLDGCKA